MILSTDFVGNRLQMEKKNVETGDKNNPYPLIIGQSNVVYRIL